MALLTFLQEAISQTPFCCHQSWLLSLPLLLYLFLAVCCASMLLIFFLYCNEFNSFPCAHAVSPSHVADSLSLLLSSVLQGWLVIKRGFCLPLLQWGVGREARILLCWGGKVNQMAIKFLQDSVVEQCPWWCNEVLISFLAYFGGNRQPSQFTQRRFPLFKFSESELRRETRKGNRVEEEGKKQVEEEMNVQDGVTMREQYGLLKKEDQERGKRRRNGGFMGRMCEKKGRSQGNLKWS